MAKINPDSPLIDQLSIQKKQAEEAKKRDTLGQKDFLELMIAQFENQNPNKPMDNGDFLAQMAQFSTVSGIQEMQKSFNELSSSLVSNQALQASSLVGRQVLVPSDVVELTEQGGMSGAVELTESTSDLVISIQNDAGQLVKRLSMGSQAPGMIKFDWNGTGENGEALPAGKYSMVAEAKTANGQRELQTLVVVPVESVSLGRAGQSMTLNIGGLGSVGMNAVREIL